MALPPLAKKESFTPAAPVGVSDSCRFRNGNRVFRQCPFALIGAEVAPMPSDLAPFNPRTGKRAARRCKKGLFPFQKASVQALWNQGLWPFGVLILEFEKGER